MFGNDEEEDVLTSKEPQVTSQDPDERKAARALRIKRRQEAIKRAEIPPEEAAAEEEPGLIEQATATAAVELQRLALDGAAKVTNVKVTTDEREVTRRTQRAGKMRVMMENMEEEAIEAQVAYEAISNNWDEMLRLNDPLDIDAAMKQQKILCDDLLAQKNILIDALKTDLKGMDEGYFIDLDKQDKDIKELSERIEKQVTIMQRAYEKQLNLIELAINIEREAMVDHNNKRWEALYKQRDKEELAHIDYKFEQLDEHKQEVDTIMWDHHEKFREAKIELETLLQELQKELEKLKATCLINTEKIGYNYQVLKKREEENVFVRSQQKRKLNKMSDVANALRLKIRKAAEDGALEELRADAEILKLMQAMDDLEKKSDQFAHVNNYKFCQVWRMNAHRCGDMARDLRAAEVAMHAHILAEAPPPPPPPPPKSPLAKHVTEESEKGVQTVVAVQQNTKDDPSFQDSKDKLVRHILQQVADNSGFLIEDRLLKLIEKYKMTSRNLCTLDAIFMALEIQAEEDIELLCKVFLNYAFCPICVGMEEGGASCMMEQTDTSQTDVPPVSSKGRASSIRARTSIGRSLSASTSRSAHVGFRGHELSPDDQLLIAEADEIIQKCGDPQASTAVAGATSDATSASTRRGGQRGVTVTSQLDMAPVVVVNPFLCPVGHNLEIEPMQVLTALGEFISNFTPPDKKKLYDLLESVKPPNFTTPSRDLTTETIEQYWAQWKNIYPPEKERFWDGLLAGLTNYLPILQERERIHEEVVVLRRRNAALRRLVRGALPEMPPAGIPPHHTRSYPRAFTASMADQAPPPYARLPPIPLPHT